MFTNILNPGSHFSHRMANVSRRNRGVQLRNAYVYREITNYYARLAMCANVFVSCVSWFLEAACSPQSSRHHYIISRNTMKCTAQQSRPEKTERKPIAPAVEPPQPSYPRNQTTPPSTKTPENYSQFVFGPTFHHVYYVCCPRDSGG